MSLYIASESEGKSPLNLKPNPNSLLKVLNPKKPRPQPLNPERPIPESPKALEFKNLLNRKRP